MLKDHDKKKHSLGREVKVESVLEPVEVQSAGGEVEGGAGGSGGLEDGESCAGSGGGAGSGAEGLLLDGSGSGGNSGSGASAESGEVTSEDAGLVVRGVEGVHEGVDAGAVGAIGDEGSGVGLALGGEGGAVLVETEVAVGGVVGVDEGVEVRVDGGVVVLIVIEGFGDGLLGRKGLLDGEGGFGSGDGTGDGGDGGFGSGSEGEFVIGDVVGVVGGGVLSAGGDVSALEDSESVGAGGVFDGVGLAVVADVGVLSDTVSVGLGLLAEDGSVLGGEGGSGAAVADVEALLLEDLGLLGVDVLGGGGAGDQESGNSDHGIHFCEIFNFL